MNRPVAGAATAPAIRCETLSFTYPDGTVALRSVDLDVASGERVAVIGQNGSGKSTLVRQFNGLLRPTAGSVSILGTPVGRRHVADLAHTVGLAFQNPDRQIFAGRVGAEVAFGPRNLGMRGRALDEAVADALELVGLGDAMSTNPYDLGFSDRKLLALASILAMRTPIVVLDEPTTGQDARGIARIEAIVDRLSGNGTTVLTISHDMRFVAESFARIVVMREGRIVADGTPRDVFAEAGWPALRSTNLEPTIAAQVGATLGLGSTPTETALIAALKEAPGGTG